MEEGLQVIRMGLVFHSSLKLEKRGVSKEHHRKGAHANIMHGMLRLRLLTGIRHGRTALREHFSQD
jgi:hypothetical protein